MNQPPLHPDLVVSWPVQDHPISLKMKKLQIQLLEWDLTMTISALGLG